MIFILLSITFIFQSNRNTKKFVSQIGEKEKFNNLTFFFLQKK